MSRVTYLTLDGKQMAHQEAWVIIDPKGKFSPKHDVIASRDDARMICKNCRRPGSKVKPVLCIFVVKEPT